MSIRFFSMLVVKMAKIVQILAETEIFAKLVISRKGPRGQILKPILIEMGMQFRYIKSQFTEPI